MINNCLSCLITAIFHIFLLENYKNEKLHLLKSNLYLIVKLQGLPLWIIINFKETFVDRRSFIFM